VYAYKLEKEGFEYKTDDGEPAGSSGIPVLNVLSKFKLE